MVRACVRAVQTKTTPIGIEPKTLYGVIRTSTIYADICALQSDAMVSLLSQTDSRHGRWTSNIPANRHRYVRRVVLTSTRRH